MVVPAKPDQNQSSGWLDRYEPEVQAVILHVAELFGLGHARKDIVRVVAAKLYGREELPPEIKLQNARRRVRSWEKNENFRDLVWDRAVVELDMSTPQILRGVAKKAKRGRVDAAKLALSITGRHVDKAAEVPAAVTINIANIPRPARQLQDASNDEIVVEADDE